MGAWLFFYCVIVPWIGFLVFAARRPGSSEKARTTITVFYAVSLVMHGLLLVWVTLVVLAFRMGSGTSRPLVFALLPSAGLLLTFLGHVGVLVHRTRPRSRWLFWSTVALPLGWLMVALVLVWAAASSSA